MSYSFVGLLSNMGVARAKVKVLAGLLSPEVGRGVLCSCAQAVGRVQFLGLKDQGALLAVSCSHSQLSEAACFPGPILSP